MERTDILALMGDLKLYGMRTAYDEVMAAGIKRQHEPPRIVGDLLKAEIAEKQARSIKYQMTIAKLPLAKDIDGFEFCTERSKRRHALRLFRPRTRAGVPRGLSDRNSVMSAVEGLLEDLRLHRGALLPIVTRLRAMALASGPEITEEVNFDGQ
jgi:hypothetical protein